MGWGLQGINSTQEGELRPGCLGKHPISPCHVKTPKSMASRSGEAL